MITIKLIGGAKKSFNSDELKIDKSDISVNTLLELLSVMKPTDTSEIDVENILIAINGSDSSAMNGKDTIVHDGDIVSIIPVIHGGSSKKLVFEIEKKQIQILEIRGQKNINIKSKTFLDTHHNQVIGMQLLPNLLAEIAIYRLNQPLNSQKSDSSFA